MGMERMSGSVGEAGTDIGAEDGQLVEGLFQRSLMEERLGWRFRIDKLYIFKEAVGCVMGRVLAVVVIAEGTA
jgi:hypothetical protein